MNQYVLMRFHFLIEPSFKEPFFCCHSKTKSHGAWKSSSEPGQQKEPSKFSVSLSSIPLLNFGARIKLQKFSKSQLPTLENEHDGMCLIRLLWGLSKTRHGNQVLGRKLHLGRRWASPSHSHQVNCKQESSVPCPPIPTKDVGPMSIF